MSFHCLGWFDYQMMPEIDFRFDFLLTCLPRRKYKQCENENTLEIPLNQVLLRLAIAVPLPRRPLERTMRLY